jgi:hypothetical protein
MVRELKCSAFHPVRLLAEASHGMAAVGEELARVWDQEGLLTVFQGPVWRTQVVAYTGFVDTYVRHVIVKLLLLLLLWEGTCRI